MKYWNDFRGESNIAKKGMIALRKRTNKRNRNKPLIGRKCLIRRTLGQTISVLYPELQLIPSQLMEAPEMSKRNKVDDSQFPRTFILIIKAPFAAFLFHQLVS